MSAIASVYFSPFSSVSLSDSSSLFGGGPCPLEEAWSIVACSVGIFSPVGACPIGACPTGPSPIGACPMGPCPSGLSPIGGLTVGNLIPMGGNPGPLKGTPSGVTLPGGGEITPSGLICGMPPDRLCPSAFGAGDKGLFSAIGDSGDLSGYVTRERKWCII